MSSLRISIFALLFILTASASASHPTLSPQSGILLLRNGQVLQGEITRAGDYFVLTIGPASEIRLKAEDVEIACETLDEAYLYRLQRLDPTRLAERINLAEWCLRVGLLDGAEEQIDLIGQSNSKHPRLETLKQRLKFARAPKPAAVTTKKATLNVATVSPEQLEKTLRDLPKGSVEKFTAIVQPILLNGCATNGCHGPNSKSQFQLLKPAIGQVANQRFSQRNLYSALQYLNHEDALNSPLVVMPQKRHGGSAGPIFDERTKHQFDELIAWVQLTTETTPPPAVPSSIDPSSNLVSAGHHPQTNGKIAPPGTQAEPATKAATQATWATSPTEAKAAPAPPQPGQPFVPRDPFDPEIFNRRFFGK